MGEYCLNCGKMLPRKLSELRDSDEYDKDDMKFPNAWRPLGDWVEIWLDPEKIRSEPDEQLWFVFLCPECKLKLKEFLEKTE